MCTDCKGTDNYIVHVILFFFCFPLMMNWIDKKRRLFGLGLNQIKTKIIHIGHMHVLNQHH